MKLTKFLLPVLCCGLITHQTWAQSSSIKTQAVKQMTLNVEKMTDNLGVIWAMDFLNETQIVFTIRDGKAGIFDTQNKTVKWLSGLPEVYDLGQGGLLDVAVVPTSLVNKFKNQFKDDVTNHKLPISSQPVAWLYFTYSKPEFLKGRTTLARAQLKGGELVNWQDLLVTKSTSLRNIHFGSRIAFDENGYVFFTIGDRGVRDNAQDLSNHAGTIIRLHLDGRTPADNPFVNHKRALPEIWSYGHRNPQGLAYDVKNKRLWTIEHGPRGGDEINLVEKGKNYGWPLVSQGLEYYADIEVGADSMEGMQEPIKVYTPSIAPSDLNIYQASLFPDWQGDLLTGALKLRHLNRVKLKEGTNGLLLADEETRYLETLNERIRSMAVNKPGVLWIGTDRGRIYKVTPSTEN